MTFKSKTYYAVTKLKRTYIDEPAKLKKLEQQTYKENYERAAVRYALERGKARAFADARKKYSGKKGKGILDGMFTGAAFGGKRKKSIWE